MVSYQPKVYTQEIVVQKDEIDYLDHVNNIIYLKWVQDIAIAHWQFQALPQHQKSSMWVVLNHYIEYKSPGFLDDHLIIKTHVGETSGVRSERIVEIFRDQTLLAKATTTWCMLDPVSKRPKKITTELEPFFTSLQNENLA